MRLPSFAVLALLLSVVGCPRCNKGGSSGVVGKLEHLLPQNAELIAIVPELNTLGERLTRLQNLKLVSFAAQLQGMPSGADYASALFSQVGVDLRSKESIEKAGIDGTKGLGIAVLPGNTGYSVVPVKDEGKLKAFLATLARNRLGATVESKQGPLTVFSRAQGTPPALGYRLEDGYALIAPADALNALTPNSSLAQDPAFTEGVAKLPKSRELTLYVPATSKQLPSQSVKAVFVAVQISDAALTFASHLPLSRTEATALFEPKRDAAKLIGLLPRDAFAVVRYQGDPLLLQYVWPSLAGARLTEAFKEAGFDVGNEVLQNLKPGVMAAVSLSPQVNLAGGVPELDVRRTNPFRFINLVGVAEVKDKTKASLTLDKLPLIAPKFGAKLTPVARAGKKVYEASYAQGEGTHVALIDDHVLLAAPMARMEQMLASEGKGSVAPELADALDGPALGVIVDLQKLAASVRALPDSAWGLGGFAMKASTLRWLDGLSELRGIWLTAKSADGAVSSELSLRFAKP
ncbi:MAG: hypothetical protein ACT4TC_12985 [Myxococcaceae bacterium]